jgi:ribosomal protein S7
MNNKTLYKIFLGFLLKQGNLISAKRVLDNTFLEVTKKTGISKESALLKVFFTLNSFVEVKKVRVKRRFYLVPFSIGLKRRSYLVIKWLLQSILKDKKTPLFLKLSFEIIKLINNDNSRAKKIKNFNISQALKNRSNIHYRW